MIDLLIKIDRFLIMVLKLMVGLLMAWTLCILFAAAVFRYFLNSPIFWADEAATYSLVGIAFLGAYLVLRHGKMVKVTFIVDLFPKPIVKAISLIANLLTIVFIALIGYQGLLMTQQRVIIIQTTVALRMPMVIFYALIPIMSALIIFGLIIELLIKIFPEKFKALDIASQRGGTII